MLSSLEIATLIVVKNAPCRIGPGRAVIHTLLDVKPVMVERPVAGFPLAPVTPRDDAILRAIARIF